MELETVIAVLAIALALAFDFVNGFHDTANACATVIYTKALKPSVAIVMSGILNFMGALLVGTAVAQVITKIIPAASVTLPIVVAVLIAAVVWNLITWWYGIPVSSSHCLIGSLFGAGITAAVANGADWRSGVEWHELQKVILALANFTIGRFCRRLYHHLGDPKNNQRKRARSRCQKSARTACSNALVAHLF
jgi:phosphate/sulfate permease